ncbi:MAG: EamA family transporter [Patescibacteria group bacterium]
MIQWLLPLSILIVFELIADILAKSWSLKGGWLLVSASLLGYLIANTFWLFALKNGSGLGRGAIIFSLVSAIIAILLGIFLYHEKTSTTQIIGMTLGIVSLIFIFWE